MLQPWFDGRRWVLVRALADLLVLITAAGVARAVTAGEAGAFLSSLLFPPLTIALLASRARYRGTLRDAALDSLAPGTGAVSIAALFAFVAGAVLTGESDIGSARLVATWIFGICGVVLVGGGLVLLQQSVRCRGLVGYPTLIIGADAFGSDVAGRLARTPSYGLRAVGFLDGSETTRAVSLDQPTPPVLGGLSDLPAVVEEHGITHVILGFPDASWRELLQLVAQCDRLGLTTTVVPRLYGTINYRTQFEYLGTLPLLNLRAIDSGNWRFTVKHAIDRVAAAALLFLAFPAMVAIAVAVKATSAGPVFYRQSRTGRDGQHFDLLKFRSMRPLDLEAEPFVPLAGMAPGGVEGVDRRTTVGRVLRRTSLDELPQLINVLRGDMSFVGPRPERPEFAKVFSDSVERYQDRGRVKSGITGWAQVHGLRGQTSLPHRVELDNFYIEHWSLGLDLRIIIMTIPELFRGR